MSFPSSFSSSRAPIPSAPPLPPASTPGGASVSETAFQRRLHAATPEKIPEIVVSELADRKGHQIEPERLTAFVKEILRSETAASDHRGTRTAEAVRSVFAAFVRFPMLPDQMQAVMECLADALEQENQARSGRLEPETPPIGPALTVILDRDMRRSPDERAAASAFLRAMMRRDNASLTAARKLIMNLPSQRSALERAKNLVWMVDAAIPAGLPNALATRRLLTGKALAPGLLMPPSAGPAELSADPRPVEKIVEMMLLELPALLKGKPLAHAAAVGEFIAQTVIDEADAAGGDDSKFSAHANEVADVGPGGDVWLGRVVAGLSRRLVQVATAPGLLPEARTALAQAMVSQLLARGCGGSCTHAAMLYFLTTAYREAALGSRSRGEPPGYEAVLSGIKGATHPLRGITDQKVSAEQRHEFVEQSLAFHRYESADDSSLALLQLALLGDSHFDYPRRKELVDCLLANEGLYANAQFNRRMQDLMDVDRAAWEGSGAPDAIETKAAGLAPTGRNPYGEPDQREPDEREPTLMKSLKPCTMMAVHMLSLPLPDAQVGWMLGLLLESNRDDLLAELDASQVAKLEAMAQRLNPPASHPPLAAATDVTPGPAPADAAPTLPTSPAREGHPGPYRFFEW